jgi:hypothetical protein
MAAASPGRLGANRLLGLRAQHSYVLVLPGSRGWGDRIVEREGAPPHLGDVIYDDELGGAGQAYVVKVVGPSPLPGDRRPCAVLGRLSW